MTGASGATLRSRGGLMVLIFRFSVVAGFVALSWILFRGIDYLQLRRLTAHPGMVSLSLLLMLSAFGCFAFAWQRILLRTGIRVSYADAFISAWLPVFARYVPGRIWSVVGQAGYVAGRGHDSMQVTAEVVRYQLLAVWSGLVVGIVGVGQLGVGVILTWTIGLGALTVVLFNVRLVGLANRMVGRHVPLWVDIPVMRFRGSGGVIGLFLFAWLLMTGTFWAFCRALSLDLNPSAAFAFPAAMSVGVLAIVMPGGLGVREGALTTVLVKAGMSLTEAGATAMLARYWSLVGEGVVFLVAGALYSWRLGPRWRRTLGQEETPVVPKPPVPDRSRDANRALEDGTR